MKEFKEDLINLDEDLVNLINRYNDSYYGDGWDYTIEEVKIK